MVNRGRRILLLGDTGKLGQSLLMHFPAEDTVIRHNSRTCDAGDFLQLQRIIEETRPELVINTIAFLGIDACEKEPELAFRINTLLPKFLAEAARDFDFTLVHFSTESVFDDSPTAECYGESAAACPINIYGMSKFGGDCFVQASAPRHYIFRIALLFGPSDRNQQFVERMLEKIRAGAKTLRIADDIILTPSYSLDVAAAAMKLVSEDAPYGLYHLTNSGTTTLHAFLREIVDNLGLDVQLEKGSHLDFPSLGRKNTCTPLHSEKTPPLRSWQEAVADYCRQLSAERPKR
jgi:dTDP-4-dehydrorhamnose reductase